jgi:hypothetical protein
MKLARGGDLADAVASLLAARPFFEFVSEDSNALVFAYVDSDAQRWRPSPKSPPSNASPGQLRRLFGQRPGPNRPVSAKISENLLMSLSHHRLRHWPINPLDRPLLQAALHILHFWRDDVPQHEALSAIQD